MQSLKVIKSVFTLLQNIKRGMSALEGASLLFLNHQLLSRSTDTVLFSETQVESFTMWQKAHQQSGLWLSDFSDYFAIVLQSWELNSQQGTHIYITFVLAEFLLVWFSFPEGWQLESVSEYLDLAESCRLLQIHIVIWVVWEWSEFC